MTPSTETRNRVVFLLDVDNTLLDNDHITSELRSYLTREFGSDCQERYWAIFESLRSELGYADYLGALQRYRVENLRDPDVLRLSSFLVNYPFASRLYPGALDYVLVDDKVRILTVVKDIWGARLTTVLPRQGHYAHDPDVANYPTPDLTIDRISDLLDYDLPVLLQAARSSRTRRPLGGT